jgi:hypothetical protein
MQSLGYVACNLDQPRRAAALLWEALALARDAGANGLIAAALVGLAGVACAERQFTRAGRLLGAADVLLRATGHTMPVADKADHQRYLAIVRGTVGGECCPCEALAAGRAMTLTEAVAFALHGESP